MDRQTKSEKNDGLVDDCQVNDDFVLNDITINDDYGRFAMQNCHFL